MRLLNARNSSLEEFVSEEDIPPYAILSHTWGRDEVRLQEWQQGFTPELEPRLGYQKIVSSCQQALRDGIEWIWADT